MASSSVLPAAQPLEIGVEVVPAGAVVVEKIQKARWQVFVALVAQRPHRRPVDQRRAIEGVRCRHLVRVARRSLKAVLRIAEQQDLIRENGIARREIGDLAPFLISSPW